MSESGEFARIRAIIARLGPAASAGIGDDCAVVPDGKGRIVVSTDMSVEGVHFRTEWLSLEEIGWRAAASALSDLAAEGATTVGLLASVGCPEGAPPDAVVQVMGGVGDAVREAGGTVLGGDLSRAPQWVVDITVLGRTERPVRRGGARSGDMLWVSGTLGGARAALKAWQARLDPAASARAAFAHPIPRLALGRALAAAGATAMLDVSDGLAGDARHLARRSGVQLVVDLDRVPVHPDAGAAAARAGESASVFAARGGEDYELLVTIPASITDATVDRVARQTGVPLTRIGEVLSGSGVHLLLDGREQPFSGFDHFA